MGINKVGVVGAGLMGSGIAEVAARAGSDLVVMEIDDDALAAGKDRIESSLARGVERSKLSESDRNDALGRMTFTTSIEDFGDRHLVIEAATENEDLKKQLFADLDNVVSDTAILASNTSSIPITRLAAATGHPGRVIGLHFFNPVPVMTLVELVTTIQSDPQVETEAEAYVTDILGKNVVRSSDRAGFIVNMLLAPYLLEAIKMYEGKFASAADIDRAMREGMNHPMGPLELADFVGLDTLKAIVDVLYDEYRLPAYASPPVLTRMIEAGQLGRKTGRGFYDYQA